MKRWIHESTQEDDWAYNSTNDVNSLKDLMDSNADRQDYLKVGTFWYDPQNPEAKKEIFYEFNLPQDTK